MFYPALSVTGPDGEFVLAVVDDYFPTAADQNDNSLTIYFRDARTRDAAKQALAAAFPEAAIAPREVDDEDWARRSQENLQPISVGRIGSRSNDTSASAALTSSGSVNESRGWFDET